MSRFKRRQPPGLSSITSVNSRIWPHKRVRAGQEHDSSKALDALFHTAQWFAATIGVLFDQMRQFANGIRDIADAWPMISPPRIRVSM